jgi:hypothetical protein
LFSGIVGKDAIQFNALLLSKRYDMRGVGLQAVSRQDLQNHAATIANIQDQIYSPLYDSATFTSNSTTSISFFTTPRGQGTTTAPGASGAKSYADTNLQLAGQLALGNRFYCTGIEFQIFPGINPGRGGIASAAAAYFVNDLYTLSKSGYVQFTIQNRDYLIDSPLINFPPVNRLAGFASASDATTAAASLYSEIGYASVAGAAYNIVPVYIEPTQAFSLNVFWPAPITMPSSTNARIFARLRGRLIRNAQ